MSLPDWQIDLRALGYDADFDYESLKAAIEGIGGTFWSLNRMPAKKDPEWREWAARATRNGQSVSVFADSEAEAMGKVLLALLTAS